MQSGTKHTGAPRPMAACTTNELPPIRGLADPMQMRRLRDPLGRHALADPLETHRAGQGDHGQDGGSRGSAPRGVVQRLIAVGIDKDQVIYTKQDGERPPGCLPGGHQGDHTTPYTSLQHQVANAIEGVRLDDAWVNLYDTLTVYNTLPGWAESKKFTTGEVGPYVENLLKTKGDIEALQLAVTQMLVLRNQIALTSLPNPKGGFGNGEGKWSGSLQYQERQFQLGKKPELKASEVLDYIWKAFDHGRLARLEEDKQKAIILQHAITMGDAYPQLNAAVGVNAAAIVDHYPTQKDWAEYDPK